MSEQFQLQTIISLIQDLQLGYVNNNGNSKNSLIYLLKKYNISISQSELIQLGNKLEQLIKHLIIRQTPYKTLTQRKCQKGKHQMDLCVKNLQNKRIIYAEFKVNLELDTEKTKMTCQKIQNVQNELQKDNEEYEVTSYLVSLRFLNKNDIPKNIIKKFQNIQTIGLNELLGIFNIEYQMSEHDYIKIIQQFIRNS